MKYTRLLHLTLWIITNLFLLNGFAEDYTQWRLPDGAKMRLGKGIINDIKFSPDDTQLAVATSIGVWLYDAQTGAEIALLKDRRIGHQTANTLSFSPDGITLASGLWRYGGPIQLWDTTTGEKSTTLEGEIGGIRALTFSADGSLLFCAHSPRDAKLGAWQITTGQQVMNFSGKQNSRSGFNAPLVVSQDTRFIAGASDNIVKIWEVRENKLRHTLNEDTGVPRNSGLPQTLAFSLDGKTLAAGRMTIRLWDVESGDELAKFPEQPRPIDALTFSPDGKILTTGNYAGTILLWYLPSHNHPIPTTITGHNTLPIVSIAFTADSKTLASGSRDGTIRLWDVTTRNQKLAIPGHTGQIKAIKFLQDGKTLFTCGTDGTFGYWNSESGTQRLVPTKRKWYVFALALSKDETMMASGSVDGLVHLWDTESNTIIATLRGHTHGSVFKLLQFSEDGKTLASGDWHGAIQLWDVETKKHQHIADFINAKGTTAALKFSPDGKTLAKGLALGTVDLWDVATKTRIWYNHSAHADSVTHFAFTPDAKTLVSGSTDGTILVWDLNHIKHIGR